MTEETKKRSNRGLFIVLILLLLGLNAWLFFNAYKNKEEEKKFEQQITQKDSLMNALNEEYTALQLELQTMRGESAGKDSLIAQLQSELTAKKDEISELLKSKNFMSKKSNETQKLLDDAKAQIASLQQERDGYMMRLDSVTAAYEMLMADYDSLEVQYTGQIKRGDQLTREKDSIFSLGRVIMADNISVTGVQSKSNGKEVDKSKAKKADRLKVCFDLLKNKLSAGKQQTVYVKIIDPQGLTLYDELSGSGKFDNKENNEDSRYTTSVTLDYAGDDTQSYCVYWNQQNAFAPGEYQVQIFHEGYSVGKSTFTLKKSLL